MLRRQPRKRNASNVANITNNNSMTRVSDPVLGTEDSAATPLLGEENSNNGHTNEPTTPAPPPPRSCHRFCKLILSPLTDGSGWGVAVGLATIAAVGTALGLVLPQNPALPTPWYRAASNAIGYTYFTCWSISFYPQVLSNYARKTTEGLSAEFCGLNVIGFACYSAYNLSLFFSPAIQELYKERHGGSEVTVQSNDVAFAVHALVLSTVTLFQIAYYNGVRAVLPSRLIGWIMVGILVTVLGYTAVVGLLHKSTWLDFLYVLSYMKVFISLIKYIPQVALNVRRKSTDGWNVWNILLDFPGGLLSVLQLVFDCADMGDWTGITGNLAKFGLGFVSIVFDLVFMLQHYVLYTPDDPTVVEVASVAESEEVDEPVGDDTNQESSESIV